MKIVNKKLKAILLLIGIVACTIPTFATIYEDAEDNATIGWVSYGNIDDATIENVEDIERGSRVIKLTGDGKNTGFRLGNRAGRASYVGAWHNQTEKVLKWSMKYSEPFRIYIPITTEHGNRFLTYTNQSADKKGKIRGEKVNYGLGEDSIDGTWHTFTRDLEADWNAFMPDDPFVAVNGFFIKGSGMVDDISVFSANLPSDVPVAPGPYIGATDINKTSVKVNFLDNSNNEDGFLLFDESGDINVTVPKNSATAPSQTYLTLTGLTCDRTYTIRALAFNSSGNSTTSDARAFNIHSTFGVACDDINNSNTSPTIQLNGNPVISIVKGLPYVELGATANDNEDGDISSNITTVGSVNTDIVGEYTVTYTIVDSGGLQAQVSRTINVVLGDINGAFNDPNVNTEHNVHAVGLDTSEGTLKLVLDGGNGDTTFPFIWVANSGEGTISLLSTETGVELGRYRTGPTAGGNPSRTTVDQDGNVWVGNRNGNTITKVGLKAWDQCIDRNGNGVIDTSTGGTDVKAWTGFFGDGQGIANAEDECILQHVTLSKDGLSANAVRLVAVDADNNVFAGGSSSNALFKVNGATGAIISVASTLQNHYGGVIDKHGNIWSMPPTHNGTVQKISADMSSKELISLGHSGYGITIDKYGKVWTTELWGNSFSAFDPSDPVGTLQVFHQTGHSGAQGIASDANGDIFIAGNLWSNSVGQYRQTFDANGNFTGVDFVKNHIVQSGPTGVAVDATGKVWASNRNSNSVSRIDPITETVDHFPVGSGPYNYSDMTGNVVRNITKKTGTWEATFDSQEDDYSWNQVKWRLKDALPVETKIKVFAKVANSTIALSAQQYVEIQSGVALNLSGRYLKIKVELSSDNLTSTPEVVEIELY